MLLCTLKLNHKMTATSIQFYHFSAIRNISNRFVRHVQQLQLKTETTTTTSIFWLWSSHKSRPWNDKKAQYTYHTNEKEKNTTRTSKLIKTSRKISKHSMIGSRRHCTARIIARLYSMLGPVFVYIFCTINNIFRTYSVRIEKHHFFFQEKQYNFFFAW